jgi:hypothetical protein
MRIMKHIPWLLYCFVALSALAIEKQAVVPAEFRNPWPAEQERAFQQRAKPLIAQYQGKASTRSDGEGEKWGLPMSILAYLAGDKEAALAAMQAEDNQAERDHAHTKGIDLYWCFTLKGQMRKYFLFGDELAPAYRARMKEAGQIWSAEDPRNNLETVMLFDDPDPELHAYATRTLEKMTGQKLGADREKWRAFWKHYTDQGWKELEEFERLHNPRPHPKYGVGTGPVGGAWDPAIRGFWADARNTDNLRGMRETAVYLMAEETGNELTRRIFKAKLLRTAKQFLGTGMGEWDSEGYHAHTLTAYLNLYDFARDPAVRGYAKAILDYLSTAAAVKYFRGGWGGPVKRDYGNLAPWSASACAVYPWFGAAGGKAEPENDQAHVFTSAYRPPLAVVKLAQKNFAAPVELLNSHPAYEAWFPGNADAPEYYETIYYGRTFQLGTEIGGNRGDMNGFKLLVANPAGLADFFVAASSTKPTPGNLCTSTAGGDRIAQYRNLALFLNGAKPDAHFFLSLPAHATPTTRDGVTFIQCHQTWIALYPVNARFGGATSVKGGKALTGKGQGGDVAGFALEVGEGDFQPGKLLHTGTTVEFVSATGAKVKMTYRADGLPEVWRNGELHDWKKHFPVYQTATSGPTQVSLGWQQRRLRVACGGSVFEAQLTDDGQYTFTNQ